MTGQAPPILEDRNLDDEARGIREGRASLTPALTVEQLRVRLGGRDILHGIDLNVAAGEIVGIVGPPGAGKTTIIKAVTGAITPAAGRIAVSGRTVPPGSPRAAQQAGIAAIYQDLALVPNLSPVQNIVLGDEPRRRLFGVVPMIDHEGAARDAAMRLNDLGVTLGPSQYHAPVQSLSGGQRQAIAIARALRASPDILLMDEPTAALGHGGRAELIAVTRRLAKRGVAVVIVSHDIDTLAELAHRLVVVRRGRVRAEAAPGELDLDQLREEAGDGVAVDDEPTPPWYRFDLARWIRGSKGGGRGE